MFLGLVINVLLIKIGDFQRENVGVAGFELRPPAPKAGAITGYAIPRNFCKTTFLHKCNLILCGEEGFEPPVPVRVQLLSEGAPFSHSGTSPICLDCKCIH